MFDEILEEYFIYFDLFFESKCSKEGYILLKYKEIKKTIKKEIEKVNKNNFFQTMRKVLDLDAQLQIMKILLELTHTQEEEIVTMAVEEYVYYYKELVNIRLDEPTPHSILHIFQLKN
ncbi:hypothetical protein D7L51_12845 [Enterococcus faecalis]|nr:hypothetical protein [Enterococcus faecalis]EGO8860048.1 hypothetical protein [Enterococcus faecalis]